MSKSKALQWFALGAAGALVLGACAASPKTTTAQTQSAAQTTELTLITHDSFTLPDDLKAEFEKETGLKLTVTTGGDGGQLANQLVLTKDAPVADAFFGVDNSFISTLVDSGAIADYQPADLPAAAATDAQAGATPIDYGYVCVNVDDAWFAQKGISAPETLDDLIDAKYKGLTVVMDPAASSPGAAFLFATIAKYGEAGYKQWWTSLLANDAQIDQGWSDAYYTDFSGGGENGTFPITVSYNTSPAYTVPKGEDESTTRALLGTCTRQVEYAGVLAGAKNPEGAKKLIDFLAARDFQDTIAENMYMYPIDAAANVPEDWKKWAPVPTTTLDLPAADIAKNRATWIDAWTQLAG
ncbi:thiamine ABC transporter substrate-binding protein [Rarobacter incanus]|uniref:Thiamine transport system substrate-binding protein n=1 Tax=Rarobacter incanus TaxID=153494 RepID=A0A542SPF2_9MICO|nr:thiamine ABC transporter substrate-binding protein [Rarobacter incanus]TQK76503.1 thiamine transport system substrate-binding protein [Rarobacter incanus]